MISHTAGGAQAAVVEFSTRTGQALRIVTPRASESGFGTWCGVLWADASGHHLPAACGRQWRVDNGRFTFVNLHFPVPNLSAGQDFFAW